MKRLGEILLERGAIAITELHTGLEACHHSGGRLGTQLLKFGFVDEHALLEALSEQLGVPSVSSVMLKRAPDVLRRIIPQQVARRLQVMVFERNGGSLSIAMTNPRNPATIEEIVSYVGLDIAPHVATEAGILAALGEVDDGAEPKQEKRQQGFADPSNQWQKLWTPPPLQPAALIRRRFDRPTENAAAATFPGLTPVPNGSAVAAEVPLEREAYQAMLKDAEHRDHIGDLLLRRACALLDRCYLLAVHSGRLVGWLARGPGMVVDDIQSLSAPADSPSVLDMVDTHESYCGTLPEGPVDDQLANAFSDPPPKDVVILPLFVKSRLVAYLIGDVPGGIIGADTIKDLQEAVQKAGLAIEILIMKKKILA
jgi:hypothetical protein